MQRRRTKPLRGGPTAPSPMEFEWLDPRLLDAPAGVFGVTEGSSRGHVGVAIRQAEAETQAVPTPASRGRSIPEQGVTLWEHRPWRNILPCDHELSRLGHGSRLALIPSARGSGGNSATTTIRPAPQRGQTRVGVTVASWP